MAITIPTVLCDRLVKNCLYVHVYMCGSAHDCVCVVNGSNAIELLCDRHTSVVPVWLVQCH